MTRVSLAFLLLVAFTGAAAPRSEICRFRALDRENPFRRWLASQEVTCVAAGSPLALPSGLWNIFGRGEGTVSAAPLLVDGDAAPATIEPPLAAGATVLPQLPEKHGGVLYAPRRGSAFPVDGARVPVPADEPLWLVVLDIVLDRAAPVAVIPIAPLAPGTERAVDARNGGPPAVLGWLQVPEAERTALPTTTGVLSPTVRAGSREADPLPAPSLLHGAFVRIGDVPAGNGELRLEGRGWIPDRRAVQVRRGITVAAAPLLVRATGTLTVHWNTDQDLAALDRSIRSCEDAEEPPQLVIAVARCAAPRTGPRSEPGECTAFREQTVSGNFGSVSFDDVVPGLYTAEMRYGKLPPSSNFASVAPLRTADLRIFGAYFTAYGSVTRGGEPLGETAEIKFHTGVGFAPADEDYRVVFVPNGVGTDGQITVAACDGAPRAIVLADERMRPRARFDIDIPVNELAVHVNDTFTRESLPGATVKLEAISISMPPRVVFTSTVAAGDDGNVVWSAVPVRELHLTVSHAGYETRKVDTFTMPESGRHELDVQLLPLRGTRGRIVSDRPFESAAVVWFSPAGSEIERADLAADGTFVYANRHTPDETMAVVSASHPLWVLRAPATEGRESLSLRFPGAPAVAFDVWRAEAGEALPTGVIIGGVRVPRPVLAQHQALRRDPPLLRGSGPQHFRDLLATGPIDVVLGDGPPQRLEPGTSDVVFP